MMDLVYPPHVIKLLTIEDPISNTELSSTKFPVSYFIAFQRMICILKALIQLQTTQDKIFNSTL